jgi:hypothetical protein
MPGLDPGTHVDRRVKPGGDRQRRFPLTDPRSSAYPTPILDHVVVNARERIAEAAECYRGLGFALTPLGRHTLGSMNHLAVFERDYLELVGTDPAGPVVRRELLDHPAGLNGLVFATDDAAALYAMLRVADAPVEPPAEFSRPVALAGGSADARFRVVRVAASAAPYGRVYFCQHLTRDLVWRDEWRRHPNGAVAIARVVLAAAAPDAAGALFRRLFGADRLRPIAGGLSLGMGSARLDIITPAALAASFGAAAPNADGRDTYLAALGFRTGGGPQRVVAAADAWGVALEFGS